MWEQQRDVLDRKGMKTLIAAVKIIRISQQPSGIAKKKKKQNKPRKILEIMGVVN